MSFVLSTELLNLLINPISRDFALRWHRDDIPEDASMEEEQNRLNNWHYGVCSGNYYLAFARR